VVVVGLISNCHDTVFVPVVIRTGYLQNRSRKRYRFANLLCCGQMMPPAPCQICLHLLSHRGRFNPLRLSCIGLTARGLSLRLRDVAEDRTAVCSPTSHRAPVGTELISYLVAVFTESRVATVIFVMSAPPSVRPSAGAAGRLVVKFDSGHFVKRPVDCQLN
jgi:hypothetical protein